MGRWVSACSPGLRTRARSRFCSSAIWRALDAEPVLIVPNRSDVDRVERDLLARAGASSAARSARSTTSSSGSRAATARSAPGRDRGAARAARPARRRRRSLNGLGALGALRRLRRLARCDARPSSSPALLEPDELDGDLAELYAAYRAELDRLGLWDRDLRARAARPSGSPATSTPGHGEPVFAYGFEDLTGAEWALLEALAARAEVTVSLPYEPGRDAFASLSRTADDLARARRRADRGAAAAPR